MRLRSYIELIKLLQMFKIETHEALSLLDALTGCGFGSEAFHDPPVTCLVTGDNFRILSLPSVCRAV